MLRGIGCAPTKKNLPTALRSGGGHRKADQSECFQGSRVDPDLAEMIETTFDSVWTLEVLLLLRNGGDRAWTASALIEELRSSSLVVRQSLERLQSAGLIAEEADGVVRYAPASPALEAFVSQLEQQYRSRPASIRRLIVAPPKSDLQSFSEAFMFRKPQK